LEDIKYIDIYIPEDINKSWPLIINIHGGGLFYGSKKLNRSSNLRVAAQGNTLVSLNYSLIPKYSFEDQVSDILAAFAWISRHAERYAYRMDQVFVTADSAGALLAIGAVSINIDRTVQKDFGFPGSYFNVSAMGFISGYFDLFMRDFLGFMLRPLLLGRSSKDKELALAFHPEKLLERVCLPPCYLVTSKEDFLRKHSIRFAQKLKEAGNPIQCRCWPRSKQEKRSHVFCVTHPTGLAAEESLKDMLLFFKRHTRS
jgi:acetyl esterase